MRVLLTTGIFFPDVGGPATHVRKIAEHFSGLGWKVTVIAFGEEKSQDAYRVIRISRKYGKPISWLLYGATIFRESMRHDILYAFDLTTAGIPTSLSARALRKPFVLRIGGDPIWERIVEKGRRFLPMRAYYEQGLCMKDRPLLFRVLRFVVRSADTVITYCDFLKDIYSTFYGAKNITLIKNPFPERRQTLPERDTFTFLFAGRFVSYKNLSRVLRVFENIASNYPKAQLLLIGDGPEESALKEQAASMGSRVEIIPKVDQKNLFARINASSVALAPALTEFNPNFILESLALGKPALISRDNGLSVQLPEYMQFDPMDDNSLQETMEYMLNEEHYDEACALVSRLLMDQTWDKVVREHEHIVRNTVS